MTSEVPVGGTNDNNHMTQFTDRTQPLVFDLIYFSCLGFRKRQLERHLIALAHVKEVTAKGRVSAPMHCSANPYMRDEIGALLARIISSCCDIWSLNLHFAVTYHGGIISD